MHFLAPLSVFDLNSLLPQRLIFPSFFLCHSSPVCIPPNFISLSDVHSQTNYPSTSSIQVPQPFLSVYGILITLWVALALSIPFFLFFPLLCKFRTKEHEVPFHFLLGAKFWTSYSHIDVTRCYSIFIRNQDLEPH